MFRFRLVDVILQQNLIYLHGGFFTPLAVSTDRNVISVRVVWMEGDWLFVVRMRESRTI